MQVEEISSPQRSLADTDLLIHRYVSHLKSDTLGNSTCSIHLGRNDTIAHTYFSTWHIAQTIRAKLRLHGLRRGDTVALAAPVNEYTVPLLLAAWAEALSVCLLPHELSERGGRMAPMKLEAMLQVLKPALLIATNDVLTLAAKENTCTKIEFFNFVESTKNCTPVNEPALAASEDVAILQFTSGSSGQPKAAVITQAMLAANCNAISSRIALVEDDRMVSWLPLNHDMGLSAITLALWGGIDLVLIPAQTYARQPLIWLEALSQFRGTLSPAPASAYALIPRFASALGKRQLDLSAWRYAWAGAEPIFDHHLRAFETLLAPYGMSQHVVQPAYGMAETVVATSMNVPLKPYKYVRAERQALEAEGQVVFCTKDQADALVYVSNGKPVEGIEVCVTNEEGNLLPEGKTGRLQARGNSVLQRYLGMPGAAVCAKGWYDTGDIGFLMDGEIYVSGRAKDVITRAGLNISPYYLEQAIERELSLRPGSVAVFSILDMQRAQERVFALVANRVAEEDAIALRVRIARAVVMETGLQLDEIHFVSSAELPKTTSGKIQRNALRLLYGQHHTSSNPSSPLPKPEAETIDV